MEHLSFLCYLELILQAEVEIADSSSSIKFNGTNDCSEYFYKLLKAEWEMFPSLRLLVKLCEQDQALKTLMCARIRDLEWILDINKTNGYLHLRVIRDGVCQKNNKLTVSERRVLDPFLALRRNFFLHHRDYLLGAKRQETGVFCLNCNQVDWLELGDVLRCTGQIIALGPDKSEKAFMTYFFEVFGGSLPPNYRRQLGQLKERIKPLRYLEKISKKYLEKLEDRWKRSER